MKKLVFDNVDDFYHDLVDKKLIPANSKKKKVGNSKYIIYTNQDRISLCQSIARFYRGVKSNRVVTYDDKNSASTVGALVSATPTAINQRRSTRAGHPFPTIIFKPIIGSSRTWESSVVYQINKEIDNLSDKLSDKLSDDEGVVLKIAGQDYIVFFATLAKQTGSPKADITLNGWKTKDYSKLDPKIRIGEKHPVVWISHKKGTSANDFQNWGGISERNERKIASKKATKEFVEKITETLAENPAKQGDLYTMEISDIEIKYLSVFGRDWKRGSLNYGPNNVNVVIQGNVDLVFTGQYDHYLNRPIYKIKASHVIENFGTVGSFYPFDNKTSDYNAVFAMRYASDRSNAKLPNARLGIYPQGWRQAKTKGTKLD